MFSNISRTAKVSSLKYLKVKIPCEIFDTHNPNNSQVNCSAYIILLTYKNIKLALKNDCPSEN